MDSRGRAGDLVLGVEKIIRTAIQVSKYIRVSDDFFNYKMTVIHRTLKNLGVMFWEYLGNQIGDFQ